MRESKDHFILYLFHVTERNRHTDRQNDECDGIMPRCAPCVRNAGTNLHMLRGEYGGMVKLLLSIQAQRFAVAASTTGDPPSPPFYHILPAIRACVGLMEPLPMRHQGNHRPLAIG